MKKFVALFMLLVLAISVFALTACEKKGDPTVTPPKSVAQRSSKNTKSSTSTTAETTESISIAPTSNEQPLDSSTLPELPPISITDPVSDTPITSGITDDPSTSVNPPSSSQMPGTSDVPGTSVTPSDPNAEKLTTTEASLKNGLYVSSLKIVNAGAYMLGSNSGSNYIFKIEVTPKNGSALVFNASDMTAFEAFQADGTTPTKQDGDEVLGGTNSAFAVVCLSAKTKIDASAKSFSDGFSGTLRVNFGGKTQNSTTANKLVNGIRFTVEDTSDVKVWWVCGGDGRQVDLIKIDTPSTPSVPAEVTALITKINAIGEITATNYAEKETAVASAETDYAALSTDNQGLVTNYATLTAARTTVEEFKQAEALAQEKVTAFKNSVTATDTYEFTPAYKLLLDAADTAYEQIPATHTSQVVTEKATLETRKAQYLADEIATLPQEVQDVITSINAIGEITASNYAEKDTEVAGIETNYAALSTDNQGLVSNYSTLTAARTTINEFIQAEALAQEKITAFKNAVNGIVTPITVDSGSAITSAYSLYDLIPATHTSQASTEKATLDGYKSSYDAAVQLANDQQAVATFMTQYNAGVALGEVNATNKPSFEAIISAYDGLTTSQKALITDGTVATTIESWRSACDALKPAEPTTTTYSFENVSTGWTAKNGATDVTMTYVNNDVSGCGKAWQTSSQYKSTTITFETDETFNNVTNISLYVGSSGGSGVTYNLYVGEKILGTCNASSSGFSTSRVINYSGAAVSGKIRIEAVIGGSNRGPGIDEVVIRHM